MCVDKCPSSFIPNTDSECVCPVGTTGHGCLEGELQMRIYIYTYIHLHEFRVILILFLQLLTVGLWITQQMERCQYLVQYTIQLPLTPAILDSL